MLENCHIIKHDSFQFETAKAVLRIQDGLSQIPIRPLLHPGSGSWIRGVKKHRIPDPTVHKNRNET
jgi:hypothetical protein